MNKTFFSVVGSLLFLASLMSGSANAASSIAGYVLPDGSVSYFSVYGASSKFQARKDALKNCEDELKASGKKLKCRVFLFMDGPGYLAVFHAYSGAIGIGYNGDRQAAIDTAYKECAKLGKCPETAAHVYEDPVASGTRKLASAPKSGQCSPPTGRTVRSRTSCVNGDCVREFENGCKIRFQAAYCHNPFSGQWEWKPDGC